MKDPSRVEAVTCPKPFLTVKSKANMTVIFILL